VRIRLVLVLAMVLVAFVAVGAVLALWGGGPARDGVLTANVADLATGHAKAITVELPDKRHTKALVFLARSGAQDVRAYLAKSTHLGCRLLLPSDEDYGEGFTTTSSRFFFEDPCGGSVYSFRGKCTAGPCPRDLDGYTVEVRDDHAEIDLRHLVRGSARSA
jgi:nitrite reductase/ring-hydroxylating ferredoxin subunit